MIRIFIQKLKKINDFVDKMGCLVTILCASFIMMTVFLIVAFWPGMVSTFIEELLGGDLRFTDIIEIAALFGSQIVPNVYFEKENRLGVWERFGITTVLTTCLMIIIRALYVNFNFEYFGGMKTVFVYIWFIACGSFAMVWITHFIGIIVRKLKKP